MGDTFRHFRAALSEFYYDLPRMVALNLLWFLTALPTLFIVFAAYTIAVGADPAYWAVLGLEALIPLVLSLALFGPGTAALYHVTNRLANGWLLEVGRFWPAFRRYFWRAWLLALADTAAGLLLALNVWFYWTRGSSGVWLLSIVFGYLLVLWLAVQGYLFALLVEMDQGVRLVLRNALFMTIDNLGLTVALGIVNAIMLAVSVLPGLFPLLVGTAAITANTHNKVVVGAIERYRAAGRIIPGDSGSSARDAASEGQ